ncbi:MAG: ornithine carbamoyltransferase [Kiritimatiellia bacterium]|jgi:ornithine carbamoyltransferase
MNHLITLQDWSASHIENILELGADIKAQPKQYAHAADQKVLFMVFEKPSLRTRVSFQTGTARMGGTTINYDTSTSPLGAGKESLEDTIRVVSRYADLIVARLFKHEHIELMAKHSTVPVVNALTDFSHPCQILADLLTIREKKGRLKGVHFCFLGDGNNNVTHSLLYGCSIMGVDISVGCPAGGTYEPNPTVLAECEAFAAVSGSTITVTHDAMAAAEGADVVYTDSWMSYHIPDAERDKRVAVFTPYQVNDAIMAQADKDAIFMNCLPAQRGFEQTASVIDGPQSVVFDQAENRMYAQNAVVLKLLGYAGPDTHR